MKNFVLLFIVYLISVNVFVFGQNTIQEADVPLPEIILELPEALVGEFILISPRYEENITIYSNNKYIISRKIYNHHYLDWS